MQVLVLILTLSEELRKSSQQRGRRFLLPGKGLSVICPLGKVYSCLGMMHPDVHGGTFPLLSQGHSPHEGYLSAMRASKGPSC